MAAECAWANTLFHTDYLAAVETVGGGGEEGMTGGETGAATG